MTFDEALKSCRPNGASAQVVAAVPALLRLAEAVQVYVTTRPDEADQKHFMGVLAVARRDMLDALGGAKAAVGGEIDPHDYAKPDGINSTIVEWLKKNAARYPELTATLSSDERDVDAGTLILQLMTRLDFAAPDARA